MEVKIDNMESFRQQKSLLKDYEDSRANNAHEKEDCDPQIFGGGSIISEECSDLEGKSNSGVINTSQYSLSESNKSEGVLSVKEMVRQRELMALQPNLSLIEGLLMKTSAKSETPDVKVKLIVQQFESGLPYEKPDANNHYNDAPKSGGGKKTQSCSRLPSVEQSQELNSFTSDSCPSLLSKDNLAALLDHTATTTTRPSCVSKEMCDDDDAHHSCEEDELLPYQLTKRCLSIPTHSSVEESCINYDFDETPVKLNCESLPRQNQVECLKNSSKNLCDHNSGLDSTADNLQNELYEIEVTENSKSSVSVKDCDFSRRCANSWSCPPMIYDRCQLDSRSPCSGTSLYKLVKSLSEGHSTSAKTRKSISLNLSRHFDPFGSHISSTPSDLSVLSINPNQSNALEETVSAKWILDNLKLSCPEFNFYEDLNELCTLSKLQKIFEDLKNFISSKKDSDKVMISLFRENRSAMKLIRKQAKDLEDRYNHLQWKSVCTNRRISELTSKHQELKELEDVLNIRLANIQNELPIGTCLPTSRSLVCMLEAVLKGESLVLATKYNKVITKLQQQLKTNEIGIEDECQLYENLSCWQCQNQGLKSTFDDFAKEKEELSVLKEEISTLYNEIQKLNLERNHLQMANKALHNELQLSHNKIAHFEQDICSHIFQQKLKPQIPQECTDSKQSEIQELKNELKKQNEKIEQQNRIVDSLGSLVHATREVLHQHDQTQNIPGICKLLKMIESNIN